VFADAHQRVLLIDGDLRRGHIHTTLARPNAMGLTSYLSGKHSLADVVQTVEPGRLDFISRGLQTSNPSDLLLSAQLPLLFDSLKTQYDVILIDTPPVLVLGDGFSFAALAATNVLLLSSGEHKLHDIKAAVDQFTQRKIPLDGVIFNYRSRRANQSAYYYYGYQAKYYDAYTKVEA
jgi:tyrosine-protein kinase Etk/Wzc